MAKRSCIREILEPLPPSDVEEIRQEFCPRVLSKEENLKKRVADKLRSRKKEYKSKDSFNCEELTKFILNNNLGNRRVDFLINDVLSRIEMTGKGEDVGKKKNLPSENVLQAELYQALKFRLEEKSYIVERESLNEEGKPDIEIEHESAEDASTYRIEVKKNRGIIEESKDSYKFIEQLERYRTSDGNKDIRKVHAFVIIDNPYYLPNKHDKVSEVLSKIENLENVKLEKKLTYSSGDLAYRLNS